MVCAMTKLYLVDSEPIFLSEGKMMTRLPSGEVLLTAGAPSDIDLTLYRLGAEFIGETDEVLDLDHYDVLADRLWEIRSRTNVSHLPNRKAK